MTMRIEYRKDQYSAGAIADNGKSENREYIAVTATNSRWFKTLKNAQRWMEEQEYKKA